MPTKYQKGDRVEYRPVGGESERVSHSTGEITDVLQSASTDVRYTIKNDNTGKETTYMEMNIVRKI